MGIGQKTALSDNYTSDENRSYLFCSLTDFLKVDCSKISRWPSRVFQDDCLELAWTVSVRVHKHLVARNELRCLVIPVIIVIVDERHNEGVYSMILQDHVTETMMKTGLTRQRLLLMLFSIQRQGTCVSIALSLISGWILAARETTKRMMAETVPDSCRRDEKCTVTIRRLFWSIARRWRRSVECAGRSGAVTCWRDR